MSDDTYMRRKDAARYAKDRGFPVEPSTLAKYASQGAGPRFAKFGRIPVYKPEWMDQWIEQRLADSNSNK